MAKKRRSQGTRVCLFHQALPSLLVCGPAGAIPVFQESMNCFSELNDAWGVALALTYTGVALTAEPSLRKKRVRRYCKAKHDSAPLVTTGV